MVIPSLALGVPVDAEKVKEAVQNPGRAAEHAVQHVGNELEKQVEKLNPFKKKKK